MIVFLFSDCRSPRCSITGGNSGIGAETVRALAAHHPGELFLLNIWTEYNTDVAWGQPIYTYALAKRSLAMP